MYKSFIYLFAFGFLFLSCHKDYESGEEITSTQFMPEIKLQVEGSILGYVYDEAQQPIEGAIVEIYGATTTTDIYGVFHFKNRALDHHGTYIRISKAGYITGSDKVFPAKGVLYSRTKLFALDNQKHFASNDGGEIQMDGGGYLIFPQKGIVTANGNEFNGKVYVTAKFISPLSPTFGDEMPGDLLGGDLLGISSVLGTAGMFAVELRDESGQELQIKAGQKVQFKMLALSDNKPTTIPLWYFDENRGYWVEEGSATLNGDFYHGEVGHFSFWNCDAPFPLIEICGSIINQNEIYIPGVTIKARVEGMSTRNGYVDLYGHFCGKFPKGKKITLIIGKSGCDNALKTIEIGPFDTNVVLDPIIIEADSRTIEGKVECNGTPIKDAIVSYNYGGNSFHVLSDETGFYQFFIYTCENITEFSMFAYDPSTYKASIVENLTLTTHLVKDINVCTLGCNIDGSINDLCSYLEMAVTQGSGQYVYLWSTGDSLANTTNILPLSPKLICVTVQDVLVPSCQQTFCYNYPGKLQIFIETECFNPMQVYPSGGVQPHKYKWHNGSTAEKVILLPGESYCVTVTDAIGCIATHCGIFEEVFIDNTISNCQNHLFDIGSSLFDTGTIQVNNTTIPVTSLIGINIFETGFQFNVIISKGQCSDYRQFRLPQFKGLTIKDMVNTSCQGCTDGFIEVGYDGTADCNSCTAGGVKIYNIDNLNSDVSTLNNMHLLPAGTYYVVVEDANSGCYIAFQKVVVL
ncbi:MAG: carboxypeptidase-like regulatory domain-containing protein [Saprospiraceae bacterium]